VHFATNSLMLAALGAVATVLAALLVGYAIPGGVIAVGLLVPLATFDNALDALMRASYGISTGLLVTGSAAVLVLAYLVRFMAVALSAVDAGLASIRPSVDRVARTFGCTPVTMLGRVHVPLLRGSLLTAALIVFVEVMKELPATLIMRPFNFDTLVVQAYRLAADERLAQAAVPSLVIVVFGFLPVLLLACEIRRSRPGHPR
jgi:iron(III) transport system permease protein